MAELTKAVILARGLGTRMRRAAEGASLDAPQAAAADSGVKALIPVGRPFLDYTLSALADAGCREICLVIGPEHDEIRRRYTRTLAPVRLHVTFAVQEEALGTANAVLAAEAFAGASQFLVLNSDNYYPVAALAHLRQLSGPGLVGFDRDALVRLGNVDAARVRHYAVVAVGADGSLEEITEKPDEATWARVGAHALISMNCWRFGPAIFEAARKIGPSSRGEYELADAVRYARDHLGVRFQVVPVAAAVLDLSTRADIPAVARLLQATDVRL